MRPARKCSLLIRIAVLLIKQVILTFEIKIGKRGVIESAAGREVPPVWR